MTKQKQELLDLLKDPEVFQALTKKSSDELEDLMKGLDITDDDTMDTLSKKHQDQLAKVVKYFNKQLTEVEKRAVATAQKPQADKEAQKINKFSAANPAMKNSDVVSLMQPLYDKGKTLEECYAAACRALDVDPVSGVLNSEKAKEDKEETKTKEKLKAAAPKSSQKSSLAEDTTDDDDAAVETDKTSMSLDEIISANMNQRNATSGNPFEDKGN